MGHSHLVVEHLLKKLESRPAKVRRDVRPAWLNKFIDSVAEQFEPFTDVGRVGFECALRDEHWDVGMYLGSAERVGGPMDGDVQHIDFQFDAFAVQRLFSNLNRCRWIVFPALDVDGSTQDGMFLEFVGQVAGGENVRLKIFGRPPVDSNPAMRINDDGDCELL